jgi:protein SCO1
VSERERIPATRADVLPWRRLAAPLLALLVLAIGLSFLFVKGPGKAHLPNGAQEAGSGSGYYGTLALPAKPAPPLDLRNYQGQRVTLAQYRGKAVLVTFLYANCPDICPLIASNLRVALNLLGGRASRVQVIAVSVDPRGDTPKAVARFVSDHEMTGRMQYLIGSAGELGRTWAAWGVGSEREAGQPNLISHSALVYGISATGVLTTVYPSNFEPSEIAHDVPRLASS